MINRVLFGSVVLAAVGMLVSPGAQAQCCPGDSEEVCQAPAVTKSAPAEAKTVKFQTHCPVMGGEINRSSYVDHDGKRIYMCCKGCTAALEKDPAKYIKKLEDAGITLEKVQTLCPVMGGKVNKDVYVDHDGQRIYFCCAGCPEKFKKDPAKFMKKFKADGVALDPVPVKK